MLPNSLRALVALAAIAPVNAFWRLGCGSTLVTDSIDPIVNPGAVAGHVHRVNGGNAFGPSMTFNTTQRSTCTTCQVKQDLSNYWVPSLYYQDRSGNLTLVPDAGLTVYYLQRTSRNEPLKAYPPNFRMLAGTSSKRTDSSDKAGDAVSFVCLDPDGVPQSRSLPKSQCRYGLRAQVFFPSCWNGELDSSDHKSHLSYPIGAYNTGYCPSSHPIHLISMFFEATFSTDNFEFYEGLQGTGQPFVFANGDPTGYGFHGDFLSGWPEEFLQNAVDQCTNMSGTMEDCPVFTGNMYASGENKFCAIPPVVAGNVRGPFANLPGCNPITGGTSSSTSGGPCSAGTIAGPQLQFTDQLAKGWAYQGCASDLVANRSLKGYSASSNTMTVDKCLDTCKTRGFIYGALEYYGECFCGNSFPQDRMPPPGIAGKCSFPCKGDSTQLCGGASQMSLYRACSGSDCTNEGYVGIDIGSDHDFSSITATSIAPTQVSTTQVPTTQASITKGSTTQEPTTQVSTVRESTTQKPTTEKSITQVTTIPASSSPAATSETSSVLAASNTVAKPESSVATSKALISTQSMSSSSTNPTTTRTTTIATTTTTTSTRVYPTATSTAVNCPADNSTIFVASGSRFLVECGLDYSGGDMGVVQVKNLTACIQACATTKGCIDVSLSGVACYMKKTLGPVHYRNKDIRGARLLESPTGKVATVQKAQKTTSSLQKTTTTKQKTSTKKAVKVSTKKAVKVSTKKAVKSKKPTAKAARRAKRMARLR